MASLINRCLYLYARTAVEVVGPVGSSELRYFCQVCPYIYNITERVRQAAARVMGISQSVL